MLEQVKEAEILIVQISVGVLTALTFIGVVAKEAIRVKAVLIKLARKHD